MFPLFDLSSVQLLCKQQFSHVKYNVVIKNQDGAKTQKQNVNSSLDSLKDRMGMPTRFA